MPDCHGLILTTPFEFAIWGNNADFKVYKRFGPCRVRPSALGSEGSYRLRAGWSRRKRRARDANRFPYFEAIGRISSKSSSETDRFSPQTHP
ncbi:MAG: hypothetical protein AB1670_01835, partial [Pseudomonadota bacterium]